MRNKLLFVADLGHFKAFRIVSDEKTPHPRIKLLDSFVPSDSHGKISDKFTDEAGRFGGGSPGTSARAYGERHNIRFELERRTIQMMADRIVELCRKEPELPDIYLAAHKEMNHEMIDRLPDDLRRNLAKNLQEDLSKVPEGELLSHFQHAETAHA